MSIDLCPTDLATAFYHLSLSLPFLTSLQPGNRPHLHRSIAAVCTAGLLFFLKRETSEEEPLLQEEQQTSWRWDLKAPNGWLLLIIGVVQCVAGIASQALSHSAA